MKFKNFEVPDSIIDEYVDKLGCSIEEACEAWLCDNGKLENQEQKILDKQAQGTVGQFVEAGKGSRPNRGKRAPDVDKQLLIQVIFDAFFGHVDEIEIKNKEKYVDFVYNGANYTINLIKHRKNA